MISEAGNRIKDPEAEFEIIAAEDFEADEASFDLVVSSMFFHYIRDFRPVLEKVSLALTVGGSFIFSVEHPICTSLLKGWCRSNDTP